MVLEIFKTAKLFLENRMRKLNSNDKYNKTFNIKIIDCIVFLKYFFMFFILFCKFLFKQVSGIILHTSQIIFCYIKNS